MDVITGLTAFILYLVSTLGLYLRFKGGHYFNQKPISYLLLPGLAAVILHAIVLYNRLLGISGFQFGFFDAASSVALVISLLVLLISIKRSTEILALVFFPVSAITLLAQSVYPSGYMLPYDSPQGLKIHVLVRGAGVPSGGQVSGSSGSPTGATTGGAVPTSQMSARSEAGSRPSSPDTGGNGVPVGGVASYAPTSPGSSSVRPPSMCTS